MFLILKIIKAFILPPTLIFVGLLVSLIGIRRGRRFGKWLLGMIIVLYYLLSIKPTAYILARSLTREVEHAAVEEMRNSAIIVILGGGAHTEEGHVRPELGGTSWKRFWHGIEVYRRLDSAVPILYVGGSGDPFDPISKEAELARSYAVSIGIPGEQFWIESQSRDTYENGIAVKRILGERFANRSLPMVVLVTSATHLPRALRVFSKQGIKAIPAPADFENEHPAVTPLSFLPSAQWLASSSASVHEWLGMLGYWFQGRI